MLKIDGVDSNDPRVMLLNKTHEEYTKLLRDEARRIQNGIESEGQVGFGCAPCHRAGAKPVVAETAKKRRFSR